MGKVFPLPRTPTAVTDTCKQAVQLYGLFPGFTALLLDSLASQPRNLGTPLPIYLSLAQQLSPPLFLPSLA